MDDQMLLARYAATRDPGAFEELARRHAGLVKAVCVRVLGNSHDAEEVAQECFLELARHAEEVHSSVVGWLHRAATSRSLNVLRSRIRRKVREREVGLDADTAAHATDVTTQELHRVINSAVTELPDDLRLPMILHYFDGHSQREVASELGVNQSTISRRMHDALRQLREKLAQAGYVATAPAMMVLMRNQAAMATSDSTSARVAASGAAGKAVGSATLASPFKAAIAAALPILSFLIFDGWVSLFVVGCLVFYVARYRPNWVTDVFSSLGFPDLYDRPTFWLSRWNWITPPEGWEGEVLSSLAWSVLYLGLSLAFAAGTDHAPWGTVVLGAVVASGCAIHALRLLYRVHFQKIHANSAASVGMLRPANDPERRSSDDPTWTWFDVVQLTGMGLAGIGIALQSVIDPQSKQAWPSIVLAGTIGTGMLLAGIWRGRRLVRCATNQRHIDQRSYEIGTRFRGIRTVLAAGVAVVVALSFWIVWNPAAVRGLSLSLAALQTSMLGWMVYRVAAHCRSIELNLVRRVALVLLVSCFVLNSGICLANWLR